MKIGSLISINENTNILKEMEQVKSIALQTCQICIWDSSLYTDVIADEIVSASIETGIEISTLWAGWTGPSEWNFQFGPQTLGLVPSAYRQHRLQELLLSIPFAKRLGVKNIATHVGFLPEDPNNPDYIGTIAALRKLCQAMKEADIYFLFEAGQETPVTLLRAIQDIGLDNIGVNLDTANLILYGKGNPIDALRVIGNYVRDLHIKDGLFPTDGRNLGQEVPVGEGLVDFFTLVRMLKEFNYTGSYTIEREIWNDQQIHDITLARDFLLELDNSI